MAVITVIGWHDKPSELGLWFVETKDAKGHMPGPGLLLLRDWDAYEQVSRTRYFGPIYTLGELENLLPK